MKVQNVKHWQPGQPFVCACMCVCAIERERDRLEGMGSAAQFSHTGFSVKSQTPETDGGSLHQKRFSWFASLIQLPASSGNKPLHQHQQHHQSNLNHSRRLAGRERDISHISLKNQSASGFQAFLRNEANCFAEWTYDMAHTSLSGKQYSLMRIRWSSCLCQRQLMFPSLQLRYIQKP